jgi:hypothetical protein
MERSNSLKVLLVYTKRYKVEEDHITKFMEQSPPDGRSASQKTIRLLCNPTVHYSVPGPCPDPDETISRNSAC